MNEDNQTFSDLWIRIFWIFLIAVTLVVAGFGVWFLKLVYFIAS
jgi:hypothetical protein